MSAERTARAIVAGTWGCAGIVMAGSATNAFLAYGALGDNRALGLATGLAVDIGLCVALIGDRRLYAHGLSSNWGRVLRITTAVMSLILNTCIALRDGHYLSALMHAFLPILLVVLTEYGQDVLLKFTALAREKELAEAERQAQELANASAYQPVTPAVHQPISPTVRQFPAASTAPGEQAQPTDRTGLAVPSKPARSVSPAIASAPAGDLVSRVRPLVAEGLGRNTIAKELGVTTHQARQAIDAIKPGQRPALHAVAAGSR